MADTPLAKKLGIKPGQRLLIIDAPQGYREMLGSLPEGASVETVPTGTFDFVQLFVQNRAEAVEKTPAALAAANPGAVVWFCYPKKSSKVKTDISRDEGWESVRAAGWDTVAAVSIDDTWSGLRFRPQADVNSRRRPAQES